jgi:glycosyltransferase involved in cell wall biosynthesis
MITFCVIVPTYNRPEMLAEALRSLQAQSYKNWVAIVVNDASDVDYTPTERAFQNDARIQFHHKSKNGGVNETCNVGLDLAVQRDVDYIAILDDDDHFAPDYFEVAARVIRKRPGYGWFMSNNFGDSKQSSHDITTEGEIDYIDDYIYRKFRGDKGRLIARDVLKDIRFDDRFRASHRWPFFVEVGERTRIWAFPHNSISKRYLDDGITKDQSKKHPRNALEVRYRFAKHWYVIKKRPWKLIAYKYFLMELFKTPKRLVRLWLDSVRSPAPTPANQ